MIILKYLNQARTTDSITVVECSGIIVFSQFERPVRARLTIIIICLHVMFTRLLTKINRPIIECNYTGPLVDLASLIGSFN